MAEKVLAGLPVYRKGTPVIRKPLSEILAGVPVQSIAGITENFTVPSDDTVDGAEGSMSLEDVIALVTSLEAVTKLVKKQGKQLAKQGKAIEKLKRENADLRCELHAKDENDEMKLNAHCDRMSDLEKLVDSTSDAMKKGLDVVKSVLHSLPKAMADKMAPVLDDYECDLSGVAKEVQTQIGTNHTKIEALNYENASGELLAKEPANIKGGSQGEGDTASTLHDTDHPIEPTLSELVAAIDTLREEQLTKNEEVSSLQSTLKNLISELKTKDGKIHALEKRLKDVEDTPEATSTGVQQLSARVQGLEQCVPVQNDTIAKNFNSMKSKVDQIEVPRIKVLEDQIKAMTAKITFTQNSMDERFNAIRAELANVYPAHVEDARRAKELLHETELLKSRMHIEGHCETIEELEERVDSLTEEVTTLRTSQQDHRRAVYDWSSKIDTGKRTTEEQIKDAVRRIQSLEQKSDREGIHKKPAPLPHSAQEDIGTTEQLSGMLAPRGRGRGRGMSATQATFEPASSLGPGLCMGRGRGRGRGAGV